jgi:hypothetical protein
VSDGEVHQCKLRIPLPQPLEFSQGAHVPQVRRIPLGQYDPHWREGPIGDDIRRWAPHLLEADG